MVEVTEKMIDAFWSKAEVQRTGTILHLEEALTAALSAQEPEGDTTPFSSSGGRIAELEAERNLFKGKYRSIIALMDDTRQKVQEVVDHIQDEGDRAYLGSTNHADTLRDLVDDMDSWSFDAMLPKGDINKMERDPYAEIREQRTRANRALAALKDAVGHIEHMAAFITSKQSGYSFESLGEDMPAIKDALSATAKEGV